MSPLYVWGNHHCSNVTGFREKLHRLVTQHTEFDWIAFYHDTKLSLQEIEKTSLLQWKDSTSTLVLIFGDTNLDNEQSAEEAIEIFTKLYEVLESQPSRIVITCGPIPPWDPSNILRSKFESLDKELTKLNQRHPERYISLLDTFKPSDYAFVHHLSRKGSSSLAQTILRAINNVTRVNFLQTQHGSRRLDSRLSKLAVGLSDSE